MQNTKNGKTSRSQQNKKREGKKKTQQEYYPVIYYTFSLQHTHLRPYITHNIDSEQPFSFTYSLTLIQPKMYDTIEQPVRQLRYTHVCMRSQTQKHRQIRADSSPKKEKVNFFI